MSGPKPERFSLGRLRRALTRIEAMESLEPVPAQTAALLAEVLDLKFHFAALKRSHDVLARQLTLPPRATWESVLPGCPDAAPPGALAFPNSCLCNQASFEDPVFLYWVRRLGHLPSYHRKQWEFAFICQALFERGMLGEGRRGLGFGVGEEPLSALFASMGCTITGTDLALEAQVDTGWTGTDQHAAGKDALRHPSICDDALFDQRVDFRPADMNAISEDLTGYDFCWSACALEHLGDIPKGLAFIENSLNTLKPGGWAVHTTEYNLSFEDQTMDSGLTVLFRKKDFDALTARLAAQGHYVAAFDWTRGDMPLDRYVDLPPYRNEPHLRLLFDGYETTSIGMIVRKAA